MRFSCVSCCFPGARKWSSLSSLLIWLTTFLGYPDTSFAAQPCSPNAAKQLVWPGGEDPWTVSWQTLSLLEAGSDAGRGGSRCSFFDRKPPPHLCSVHATTTTTTTTTTSTSTALLHFWSVGCRRWQDQSAGGSLKATCEVQFCRPHTWLYKLVLQGELYSVHRGPVLRWRESQSFAVCIMQCAMVCNRLMCNIHYALCSVRWCASW